jgi:hypothetical protein
MSTKRTADQKIRMGEYTIVLLNDGSLRIEIETAGTYELASMRGFANTRKASIEVRPVVRPA